MDYQIYWLPCYCKLALRGATGRGGVRRFLARARTEWQLLVSQRDREHGGWSVHMLARHELLQIELVRSLAAEEEGAVSQAFVHLERFGASGRKDELARALAQWGRAEAARERYLRQRACLEAGVLEWRGRKAS